MKKTLFAMMALALCGTAFGVTEIKTSDYAGKNIGTYDSDYEFYVVEGDAIVTVDSSEATSVQKTVFMDGSTTIVFDGDNIWTAQADVFFWGSVNLTTSSPAATQNWIDTLTAEGQITLFEHKNSSTFGGSGFVAALIQGVAAGQEITLTGTTDTLTAQYVGYKSGNPANVQLNDGEIALVSYIGAAAGQRFHTVTLVGKGLTKSVPEPATATLSLLALAGLATRRRRK